MFFDTGHPKTTIGEVCNRLWANSWSKEQDDVLELREGGRVLVATLSAPAQPTVTKMRFTHALDDEGPRSRTLDLEWACAGVIRSGQEQ